METPSAVHKVPGEIFRDIFANLEKSNLKASRLVCQKWNAFSTPSLFDSIFICARYADLEVAEKVASTFSKHIMTVRYVSEDLRNWQSFQAYLENTGINIDRHEIHRRFQSALEVEHDRRHWCVYRKLGEEKQTICESGKLVQHLCCAFDLPRVSRVVLAADHPRQARPWCEQAAIDAEGRRHEPWVTTTHSLGNEPDAIGRCRSYSPGYNCHDAWIQLVRALHTSAKGLKEIFFESPHLHISEVLPLEIFSPSFGLVDMMSGVFSKLEKLRIPLNLDSKAQTIEAPSFTQVLSAARNLKLLQLKVCYSDWEEDYEFQCMNYNFLLAGCSFPELTVLSLDHCTFYIHELLGLLQASTMLQSLSLESQAIWGGGWRPLVQAIRDTTSVTRLKLGDIYGTFEDGHFTEPGNLDAGAHQDVVSPWLQEFFYRRNGSLMAAEEFEQFLARRTSQDEAEESDNEDQDA